MSPEYSQPYSQSVIQKDQSRFWNSGQYLHPEHIPSEPPKDGRYDLSEVPKYVNQTRSFMGFEHPDIIKLTGYHADTMRANGCGIANLYMILGTLENSRFFSEYPNVDSLAVKALSYHLNDLRDNQNNTINKGNPMFNPRAGWYHDGLAYVASQVGNVEVFRVEGMEGDEKIARVAGVCAKIKQQGRNVAVMASVYNGQWRGDPKLEETHLLTISGFELEKGKVTKMKVSDSFPMNGIAIHNSFTAVKSEMFTGKFMVFASRQV